MLGHNLLLKLIYSIKYIYTLFLTDMEAKLLVKQLQGKPH